MKIVIIGGVAGGASAAARARRLDESAEIIVLQSGPDVSFASCGMPYYIGGEISDRSKMSVQTPQSLKERLNLDVRVNARVVHIDTVQQIVTVQQEQPHIKGIVDDVVVNSNSSAVNGNKNGTTYKESYDQLILAVGAAPLVPPIPGIHRKGLFTLRNLSDMDHIVEWLEAAKSKGLSPEDLHCVVAGAGFVGLEMVEQLVRRQFQVTLVELMPQILSPLDEEMAAILQRDLEQRGVNVITGDGIREFRPSDEHDDDDDDTTSVVVLQSGCVLPKAYLTILGLGVRPDTAVIQATGTIQCTPRGHIVVDEHLHTTAANVWAVGDAIEVKNPILTAAATNGQEQQREETWAVPLAGPANRQGRMVADNIYGKNRTFKGTYAVAVVRSFELYAACVGLNEKFLMARNIPYTCIHIHPSSHAGYYPGAKSMHLKLIFDPKGGTIYGAQCVGEDGVEKRIDVIATAMQGHMTVEDLAELELCYAPPVGSAKDPVNYAGMAAQNIVEGLVHQVEWKDLLDGFTTNGGDQQQQQQQPREDEGNNGGGNGVSSKKRIMVLDVRNPSEIAATGQLTKDAINIPLNELRSRLKELPRDDNVHWVVSCASGQRSYYACRILMQNGFDHVDNLGGAYTTFHFIHPE